MAGFDKFGRRASSPSAPRSLLDARRQGVVADRHAGPDPVQQFLLADDLLRLVRPACAARRPPAASASSRCRRAKAGRFAPRNEMRQMQNANRGHAPAHLRISRKFPGTPPVVPGLSQPNSCTRSRRPQSGGKIMKANRRNALVAIALLAWLTRRALMSLSTGTEGHRFIVSHQIPPRRPSGCSP